MLCKLHISKYKKLLYNDQYLFMVTNAAQFLDCLFKVDENI